MFNFFFKQVYCTLAYNYDLFFVNNIYLKYSNKIIIVCNTLPVQ